MAPKTQLSRTQGSSAASRRPAKSYFTTAYETLTSPDNASVVRSVAVFGAAVAFFSSSYSEFLLPPGYTSAYEEVRQSDWSKAMDDREDNGPGESKTRPVCVIK